MEKVSVIVPIYNVEKYIGRCLESILAQSYENLEIICVDDCGGDNSIKIVEEYKQKYPQKIRIVSHQLNRGLGAARDTGLKAAEGAYISFIDSDDYIKRDFVESYIEGFHNSSADIVAGGYIRDENGKFTEHPSNPQDNSYIWTNISACLKMYKRQFLEENQIDFDGVRRYEDERFNYRILMKNPIVSVIPYSGYYYWLNPESITRDKKNDRTRIFQDYADYVEKTAKSLEGEGDEKTQELLRYCLASGLTANLLFNARGCGIKKMIYLYQLYNAVLDTISKDICRNKYIKLKYLKTEPALKRYAVWLVLRFRRIKIDKILFVIDSLI